MQLDVGPVKFVSSEGFVPQAEGRAGEHGGFPVPKGTDAPAHARRGVDNAAHGPDAAVVPRAPGLFGGFERGAKIHVAAAFRIYFSAPCREVPDVFPHGGVSGQLAGKDFGIAPAEVQRLNADRARPYPRAGKGTGSHPCERKTRSFSS